MDGDFCTHDRDMQVGCAGFWHTYYRAMRALQERQGRPIDAPLRDRNLGTTDSKHVAALERFWQTQLARAMCVDQAEVGSRRIEFRSYRSKSFDVCWPLVGEPKILISIKSMQSAYRNLTNRLEEAIGDSAILRLYRVNAVFGFFLFMLDGRVARGISMRGERDLGDKESGKGKGVAPQLELIEEGGDLLGGLHREGCRKAALRGHMAKGCQDVVRLAERSLIDLVAAEPTREPGIHYDAIAFAPTTIKRRKPSPRTAGDWEFGFTAVDQRLDFHPFISRLIEVARLRGFV